MKDIIKAHAHCDGPCGVYDPANARIAAEAVLSMTKKLLDLNVPDTRDNDAFAHYLNTFSRYVAIKEEEAEKTKREILILWTDYFKEEHLEKHPNLHEIVWKATKLSSACKHDITLEKAQELLEAVEEIHNIFWDTKDREVEWVLAAP